MSGRVTPKSNTGTLSRPVCFCRQPVFKLHPRPGALVLDGCDSPKLLVCDGCDGELVIRCKATREDRCEGCGLRHRQNLKRVIGSGFDERPSGMFLATATAPGVGVLPWDHSQCNHRPTMECSGKIGCRVERLKAARWNGHAPQVWSWLMTELRRSLPGVDVQFWKCWESQDRGVLHLHAIISALGVSERRMRGLWKRALKTVYSMSDGYRFEWGVKQSTCDSIGSRQSIRDAMQDHGFDPDEASDFVAAGDDVARLKVIRYVAKYCTKGGVRASTVNPTTGEIRDDGRGYRTWSASGRWGSTMKQIRGHQQAWAITQAQTGAQPAPAGGLGCAASAASLDTNTDSYAAITHPELVPVVAVTL